MPGHRPEVLMNALSLLRCWLEGQAFDAVIIPSTDEFISEFAPPRYRRLRWATGFRGSTGAALVASQAAVLFIDPRYSLQAGKDMDGQFATASPDTIARTRWIKAHLPSGARLALDPRLHGVLDLASWREVASHAGVELIFTDTPIDSLWTDGRPAEPVQTVEDFPVEFAGETVAHKCSRLVAHVRERGAQALLVADPEDVSWVLNVRLGCASVPVGDWHVVPSVRSRLLIERDGTVSWFVADRDRATLPDRSPVGILPLDALALRLRSLAEIGTLLADPRRTPASLVAARPEARGPIADTIVSQLRWCKHPREVEAARQAHRLDAAAVVRFMAWLDRTLPERRVTEFEAAAKLEALRAENDDYQGASMPLMSASGASGAQPHYVPRAQDCRVLNDHPIFWMDSGGHYRAGTTDNTITMATGTPESRHILAHTLVLQGFIALSTTRFPSSTMAFQLDPIARRPLWREGLDYGHNTGHGVGNRLNIHEGPLIGREPGPRSSIALKPGMIVSNEPGYYADDDFGIRIESHLHVYETDRPGYLGFETISRLPIDPRLVDHARLGPDERRWLADYHSLVLEDLIPLLDGVTASWLSALTACFGNASAGSVTRSVPLVS